MSPTATSHSWNPINPTFVQWQSESLLLPLALTQVSSVFLVFQHQIPHLPSQLHFLRKNRQRAPESEKLKSESQLCPFLFDFVQLLISFEFWGFSSVDKDRSLQTPPKKFHGVVDVKLNNECKIPSTMLSMQLLLSKY